MKKILFVIGSMERGGAERVISVLANEYSNKGHSVSIALLLAFKIDYELNQNIEIINLVGKHKNRLLNSFGWIKSLRRIIKTRDIDTIVSFIARINIILPSAQTKYNVFLSAKNYNNICFVD